MKKIHIIALLLITVSITILLTASKDVSTYATFKSAAAADGSVKIVGELVKDRDIVWLPEVDINLTTFYLKDENGEIKKVRLKLPKPQEFEMAEKVTLTGQLEGEDFVAHDVNLKCPSKYKDEELILRDAS